MTKKKVTTKKPCKCKGKCKGKCCGNCYGPIYIQASNPSKSLLEWAEHQNEYGKTVYIQSGRPGGGGCVPGSPGCQ